VPIEASIMVWVLVLVAWFAFPAAFTGMDHAQALRPFGFAYVTCSSHSFWRAT
jgi:hypothetical protein